MLREQGLGGGVRAGGGKVPELGQSCFLANGPRRAVGRRNRGVWGLSRARRLAPGADMAETGGA